MIFAAAGLLGILLGLLIPYNLSSATLPYVAVALVAALDSVFGALLANLNKKFNSNVFMMGLVSNAILAVLLTYVGDLLGIQLDFAAIVVFGVRIFNNMAAIRRITFDIYFEKRTREKERLKRLALKEATTESDINEGETTEETEFSAEEKTLEAEETDTEENENKKTEEK